VEYEDPAELFTVAMLHNIGEMVIAVCFHEEENGIRRTRVLEGGYAASVEERRIFGITHADIGALVLAKFNLSEDICDAVRFHHTTGAMRPEAANFRMKLISREAADLLDTFVLPRQPDSSSVLPSVRRALEKSVAENLQVFRKKRKGEERSPDYPAAFERLLNDASALLYKTLRQGLPLRVALKQKSRA
jgi:HD-like signal output (HDOD) protein